MCSALGCTEEWLWTYRPACTQILAVSLSSCVSLASDLASLSLSLLLYKMVLIRPLLGG